MLLKLSSWANRPNLHLDGKSTITARRNVATIGNGVCRSEMKVDNNTKHLTLTEKQRKI